MFIRFNVENYLSFNEKTEFNMLTGDVRRLPHHVHHHFKLDFLKSAIIYGANGAGKSNLILAINLLREFVLKGNLDFYSEENKFKLSNSTANKPTVFEIEFIAKGVGYTYGISFNEDLIEEEWLYKLGFSNKKDEMIFERKTSRNGRSKVKFHEKYRKTKKNRMLIELYEEDFLAKDKLFLKLAKGKKFQEISDAYNWIAHSSVVIYPNVHFEDILINFLADTKLKPFFNNLIKGFKTGIDSLDIVDIDFYKYFGEDNLEERERTLKRINEEGIVQVGDLGSHSIALIEKGKPIVKKLISIHKNDKGEKVAFNLNEESDGTLRLLDFIPALYLILKSETTVFIDEIDQSIHPSLLKEFIKKIQEDTRIKGQLIFTTHEANLLDLDLFRQDEIWFAEKNKEGSSCLYSLADYNIRPDLDIRKGYLSGRFGAIPFLANLKDLNW